MMFYLLFVISTLWAQTNIENGEYVFNVAGCLHCHTPAGAPPLSGNRRLETPFGVFYSPNITPDPETGIGNWSFDQFRTAIRLGFSPTGEHYYPAFPYTSYTNMNDADIYALFRYLKTFPPIKNPRREHELSFPFNRRPLLYFWKSFFLFEGPFVGDHTKTNIWNRGAYIANALAHCTECHTPRNSLGALQYNQWLAGSREPLEKGGKAPPNITPHSTNGLGSWSIEDWDRFLTSGLTPDNRFVGGEMAQVIRSVSALTPRDRRALIQYLREVPAQANKVDEK